MINAGKNDKAVVVDILTGAFDSNKSVNYIIKQDRHRKRKLRRLMEYSFDVCSLFGKIYLADDKKGCALIMFPERKRVTLQSVLLDLKLIIRCTGFGNTKKAIRREAQIKKLQPNEPMYYLWFIGVDPSNQGQGIGSAILENIIRESESVNKIVCLETSRSENLSWYQKFGFRIYNELDLGYRLYFLRTFPK